MSKKENHIKKFRHIVLMWFVLFSISPCTVKEALFYSVNTDYAKPLNKSKTPAPASSCSYSQNDNTQTSVVKNRKSTNALILLMLAIICILRYFLPKFTTIIQKHRVTVHLNIFYTNG